MDGALIVDLSVLRDEDCLIAVTAPAPSAPEPTPEPEPDAAIASLSVMLYSGTAPGEAVALRVPITWTLSQLCEALLQLYGGAAEPGAAQPDSLRVVGQRLDVEVTLPRGVASSTVRDLHAALAGALGGTRRHFKLRFGGRYLTSAAASLESYGLAAGKSAAILIACT